MSNELQDTLDRIKQDKLTNLTPENLKAGVKVLGVEGNLVAETLDTSDATAEADDIISPKTAYINGKKVTGSIIPSYSSVGSLELTDTVYTIDTVLDRCSIAQDIGLCIKLTASGLSVYSINKDTTSMNLIKLFTPTELDISTIATGQAIFYPYLSTSNIIKILLVSASTQYNTLNYQAYIYELNFSDLNNLILTKVKNATNIFSYSSGRHICRTWGERLIWLDNTTCMLVFATCPGIGYSTVSMYLRHLKLLIDSDDNGIAVLNSMSTLLSNDTYGDDWGGLMSGIDAVSLSGDYIIASVSKDRRNGSASQYRYVTCFINYKTNSDKIISETSNTGYVLYDNRLIFGNNGVRNIDNINTIIDSVNFEIVCNKTNIVDNNTIIGIYNGVNIYHIEDDVLWLDSTHANYTNTNRTAFNDAILIFNDTIMTFLYEDRVLTGLLRHGIPFLNTSDATATSNDILYRKTAYLNNEKILGTMSNNGELILTPGDNEVIIPEGYTSGGKVNSVDITKLDNYITCLNLSSLILDSLPSNLTQLEYIETNDTQYIQTDIILGVNNWKIELDWMPTKLGYQYNGIWGLANRTTYYEGWVDGYSQNSRYGNTKRINTITNNS